LLPFEPGTGNFTKIVQRVPVRIRFEPGQAALASLRPGLSTTVTVRLNAQTKAASTALISPNAAYLASNTNAKP
jgi:membrane fusion protein (multidrug efflux system)